MADYLSRGRGGKGEIVNREKLIRGCLPGREPFPVPFSEEGKGCCERKQKRKMLFWGTKKVLMAAVPIPSFNLGGEKVL